ncbi:MAG: serine/threonine protein kinase [Oscillospiraceae bacterium]|nr:serine/threonine protein kinase [Oscillospiraceae bacterium]
MLKTGETLTAENREYFVTALLGRGANAAAYLVQCRSGELQYQCILKEYAPRNAADFDAGKARFIAAARMQNRVRQNAALQNRTPPVSHIFEANDTAYSDIACFGGTTLDRLTGLTLPEYLELCRAIAKTVGAYHQAGFLVLDLKPENIFILQNASDETVTQLVEFIDFDSIRAVQELSAESVYSYTRAWAAPEQYHPFAAGRISSAADLYAIGEIVFYLLFGRHSEDTEHRGFSSYPFHECRREFRRYSDRPDVQRLLTKLFRGTLRSSAANRFPDTDSIVKLLDALIEECSLREYIIPKLPPVSPHFVGRAQELQAVYESLKQNRTLFVTGIGGIGKSTLIRNYVIQNKDQYDVIVYLEFDGDFVRTFNDDDQLQISTVRRQDGEPAGEYFRRKLTQFRNICGEKRVLFVLDNFSGTVTKDLSRVLDCGYDTVIVTRNQPPKNSFAHLEIGAIADKTALSRLILLNLERQMTKEETVCFDEITGLVQEHTLVIELIARQIAAGNLDIHTALDLIREHGFSHFSGEKIGNYKDGEEVYASLASIISGLFIAAGMHPESAHTLKILALLNVRGLETELLLRFYPMINSNTLNNLAQQGWMISDGRIRLHPVIAETVRNWHWQEPKAVQVMDDHQKMIDIYMGMLNAEQIRLIVREAAHYREQHPEHLVNAMYHEMLGFYYDALIAGRYVPENADEAELFLKQVETAEHAISEAEQSDAPEAPHYLTKYCVSLASILIRSMYPEYHEKISDLLMKTQDLIGKYGQEHSENYCYFCMVSAWYFTLVEPDYQTAMLYISQAEKIACSIFPTELEIIDIIHIPAANCMFYLGELQAAADKLEEAVQICEQHPELIPYTDKCAELLNCQLDVYAELQDYSTCRRLITEIDRLNDAYRDQGVFRPVSDEIREKAGLS